MYRARDVGPLLRESWAEVVVAVAFVQPTSPGFIVSWVPGHAGCDPIIGRRLDAVDCECGHFHVDTIGSRPDCSRRWAMPYWLEEPPDARPPEARDT